jgi:hypothetical protein
VQAQKAKENDENEHYWIECSNLEIHPFFKKKKTVWYGNINLNSYKICMMHHISGRATKENACSWLFQWWRQWSISGDDLGDSLSLKEQPKTKKGWVDEVLERRDENNFESEACDSSGDSETADQLCNCVLISSVLVWRRRLTFECKLGFLNHVIDNGTISLH